MKMQDIWRSQKVTDLLAEFYKRNFILAGEDGEKIFEFINDIFLNIATLTSEEIIYLVNNTLKFHNKKQNSKHEVDLIKQIDLKGIKEFLDIGSNNLRTINKLMALNTDIRLFHAIDIIEKKADFLDESRGRYYKVANNVNTDDYPLEDNSIDFVNIRFVLHHFNSLEEITKQITICANLLRENGRLMLWEESFQNEFNIKSFENNIESGIFTDIDLTQKFYNLNIEERIEFIYVNDWLINTKNKHMPWTGQYYNWEKWVELFEQNGFALNNYMNLGLRVNGKLKQGFHMIGEFRKV